MVLLDLLDDPALCSKETEPLAEPYPASVSSSEIVPNIDSGFLFLRSKPHPLTFFSPPISASIR